MAPFPVRHKVLLNNRMMAREEAFARVRTQDTANDMALAGFRAALAAAAAALWHALQGVG